MLKNQHFFFADFKHVSLDLPFFGSHFFLAASHAAVVSLDAGSGVAVGVAVGVGVGVSVVAPVHRKFISGNHLHKYPCQYATPRPALLINEQHPIMTTTNIVVELLLFPDIA